MRLADSDYPYNDEGRNLDRRCVAPMRFVLIFLIVAMVAFMVTVLVADAHRPEPLPPGWYLVPDPSTHA